MYIIVYVYTHVYTYAQIYYGCSLLKTCSLLVSFVGRAQMLMLRAGEAGHSYVEELCSKAHAAGVLYEAPHTKHSKAMQRK